MRRIVNIKCVCIVILFLSLSVSRIASQVINYNAPLKLFNKISRLKSPSVINLCIGKEWYRFPSSFFLPHQDVKTSLLFLDSGFTGQLPQPYAPTPNATRIVRPNFNNMNLEETSRYSNINQCDYIVDWDVEADLKDRINREEFRIIHRYPFLNAAASKSPFRSFYIPFIGQRHCTFSDYVLLKRSSEA